MGYALSELTSESLLEFAEEEYGSVKWDKNSLQKDDDYFAVWGWGDEGTYIVALAMYYERTDEEVEELCEILYKESEANKENIEIFKRGWNLKFIHEAEGPVIQPPSNFLKNRPPMTLKGKRGQKEAEKLRQAVEVMQQIQSDTNNQGVILSAQRCDNGQTFIWTTQGNYYIPEEAYHSDLAMIGILTVKALKESNVPLIPTIEEYPSCY